MGVGVVNRSGGHGWGVVGGVADRRPPENKVHLSSSNNIASTTTTTLQQQLWNDAQFINTQNGLLSLHNLNNFERGTSTLQENELVDASIVQLLKLLMTMVTECIPPPSSSSDDDINNINSNNPILLSCLHIIEYLLRKYEIHTRPLTSSMLLQTILPLQIIYPSSYYTQLFKRVISLMDLTLLPTWTFLRPYVAQGAPSVNRNMLSKFVAKDDSLALCIANIGKYGMEICIKECKLRMDEEDEDDDDMMMQIDDDGEGGVDNDSKATTNSTGALVVRRGISSLISFSASTLVEAIHIQSSSKDAGIGGGGGVQESLVRVLYPLVLSACKSGGCGSSSSGDGSLYYYCPEWKEWGRILTSTISILCPLKHDAKIGLCDAIVDGLPLVELSLHGGEGTKEKKTTKTKKKNSFQEAVQDVATVKASSLSTAIKDDASSAIMTLLSVLGTMTNDVNDGDDDDDESLEYYLPILPPKKKQRPRNTATIIDYMGCELPPSTYKRLSKEYGTSMAMYLGSVLQILRGEDDDEDDEDEDEEDDNPIIVERMAPLVASIIMHAFSRLEKGLWVWNGSSKFKVIMIYVYT